jgi:hypothetical protein
LEPSFPFPSTAQQWRCRADAFGAADLGGLGAWRVPSACLPIPRFGRRPTRSRFPAPWFIATHDYITR